MIDTANQPQSTAVMFMRGSNVAIEGLVGPQAMGGALKSFDDLPLLWRPAYWAVLQEVGRVKASERNDWGAWVKAQLDKSSQYFDAIKKLIADGKLMFGNHTVIGQLVAGKKSGSVAPLKEYGVVLQPRQPSELQQRHWLELRTRLARLKSLQQRIRSSPSGNHEPNSTAEPAKPAGADTDRA